MQQLGDQLRQGDLPGPRVQQRVPDEAAGPLLSPVSAGRGEPRLLHLCRQDLRGEYHCRATPHRRRIALPALAGEVYNIAYTTLDPFAYFSLTCLWVCI